MKAFRFDGVGLGALPAVAKHEDDLSFANGVGVRVTRGALLHAAHGDLVDTHLDYIVEVSEKLMKALQDQP